MPLCQLSSDGAPPADYLVVRRVFAPRRVRLVLELMALRVVVDIWVGLRLIPSATHGSLVFACGVR
jgi:hypothetical protein